MKSFINVSTVNFLSKTAGKCCLFCAKCGDFPQMKLIQDYQVTLKCLCSVPITITLDDFLRFTRPADCTMHNNIEKDRICLICKKRYCKKCIELHLENNPLHTLIYYKSTLYETFCQWQHPKSQKAPAQFYCLSCKCHLCQGCTGLHLQKNHLITNLTESASLDKIQNLEVNLTQKYSLITKINESIKETTIENLKKEIVTTQFIYQKSLAANFKLLEYCKFLIYNYGQTQNCPNYHLLQSLNDLKLSKPEDLFYHNKLKPAPPSIFLQRNMLLLNCAKEINDKIYLKNTNFIDGGKVK